MNAQSANGLTVVIVNWNGGQLLIDCLQSVRDSRTTFPVRVLVIDNDSQDGSRERALAEFPEYTTINSGANLGYGRANNLAGPLVETPLVLILNPDTILQPDTLEICVRCLRDHPDVGALGCKMLYPTGEVQEQGLQWFPTPFNFLLESLLASGLTRRLFGGILPTIDPNRSTYLRKLYGGFVLAPKEVLDKAGWFDDRYFMYAEDVDLSQTVLNLGHKLYYCAETHIIHVAGGTSAKAPSGFSVLMKSESIHKLMSKYHGAAGAFLYRIVVLVTSLVRLLVSLPALLLARIAFPDRAGRFSASAFKSRLLLSWSLGLKRARPAGSR
ncbi:MAG: glycosyltransferase family 2 protein [Limisphaerales bacterium]